MLDIRRVLASRPCKPDGAVPRPLLTPWGEKIEAGEGRPAPHPHPQFARASSCPLNGWWYYHCDRLGMLVMQDMVSGGGPLDAWQTSYKPTLFRCSWSRLEDHTLRGMRALASDDARYRAEWTQTCQGTVLHLHNHPCIVAWCLFNEGWGQFDATKAFVMVRELDPTRAIDATSGWYDQRCGDFLSVHNYFRPLEVYPDDSRARRAFLISEFGGLSCAVSGHCAFASSYGYEQLDDVESYVASVLALLAQIDALEERGLAGFVYTQLSDVEEETNGLVTYDRRVVKLDGMPRSS